MTHLNGSEVEKTDQNGSEVENSTQVELGTHKKQNKDNVEYTSDEILAVEKEVTLLDNLAGKLKNDQNEDIMNRNIKNTADKQVKEVKKQQEAGNEDHLLTADVKTEKPEQRVDNSLVSFYTDFSWALSTNLSLFTVTLFPFVENTSQCTSGQLRLNCIIF